MRYIIHYNGDLQEISGGNSKAEAPKSGKERKYKMTYSIYRKIASASAKMWDIRKNNIVFLTFTIGDYITDTDLINPAWKLFLNQMRKTYKLNSYIWVAERQKNGRIHYHMLADMPKWDMKAKTNLQNTYYKVMKNAGINVHPTNSLRLPPKKNGGAVVKSRERSIKYLTKYISKNINTVFSSRNYAISRKIYVKPIEITREKFEELRVLTKKYRKFDYIITYFLDSQDVKNVWDSLITDNEVVKEMRREKRIYDISFRLQKNAKIREGEVIDIYRDIDEVRKRIQKKDKKYLLLMT